MNMSRLPYNETKISVGDIIDSVGVAVGPGAHAEVHIFQGPAYPRPNYLSDSAAVLNYYTRIFVGRETEWQRLSTFATQMQAGYLLVEAPAGYGKTALVAHLIERYTKGRGGDRAPYVIYFFIRQRERRNTPVAFLQAVNGQLLDLLGVPGGVPSDLDALRSQFSQLWAEALKTARSYSTPLLLVVDGLDEIDASTINIGDVLPSHLEWFAHVIITSRPNPEPLHQVGIEHPLRKAEVIRLQAFGEPELQSLLHEYGASAEVVAAIAPRVLTLTKGEPLFARFVCQEVMESDADKREAVLARLEQHPPADVEAYFHQQFEQLNDLAEGELAWDILGLLSIALEGMRIDELSEVLGYRKRDTRKAVQSI